MRLAFGLPALALSAMKDQRSFTAQAPKKHTEGLHAVAPMPLTKTSTALAAIAPLKSEDMRPSVEPNAEPMNTPQREPRILKGQPGTVHALTPAQSKTPLPTGRVGVLLASHGDIDNLDELESYAKTAVMKNRAIPLPDFLRVPAAQLGWLFVKGGIIDQYKTIGLETHYRERSELQAEAVANALQTKGIDAKAYYGFNFAPPFIADAMEQMRNDGVEHVIVFNQGAQYSFATTAENFRDVEEYLASDAAKNENYQPAVVGVRQFSEDPRFRALLAQRIQEDVDRIFPGVPYSDVCVLMGSHGLPEPLREKGDPATQQMRAATEDVAQRLPGDLKVFQGYLNDDFFPGVPWTQPTAESLAEEIAATGRKHILLDGRLSFTVHHRATYYDLDTEARDAIQALVPDAKIVLANNFDGDAALADLISDVALEALAEQGDIERLNETADKEGTKDASQIPPKANAPRTRLTPMLTPS